MCELFGASSRNKTDCRIPLQEFYSHGDTNPHGWGIVLPGETDFFLKKEAVSSIRSSYLENILRFPVEADLLLAHIRLATKGSIEYNNTHPFLLKDASGITWALIHNGTIFESEVLSKYVFRQLGQTDSERILDYLVDNINSGIDEKGRSLTVEERIQIVEKTLVTITPENKVNIILSDGNLLYAHSNYKGGLHWKEDCNRVLISTRSLDRGDWQELPINTLFVYDRGSLIYEGVPHENEFFDSEEKLKYLYLDFAGI